MDTLAHTATASTSGCNTSPPGITIRPAVHRDIDAMLTLHREAFADKFGGAFGTHGTLRGSAALAAAWHRQGSRALRGMFVAEQEQRVIGTITLRTWEIADDDMAVTESAFHQVLGLWGTMRSLFALSLLNHRIARNEGFITDVAVDVAYRRHGVGRALLLHAEREARLRSRHYLGLYVSKTNIAAITLYQRAGFCLVRVRRSFLAKLFFGQREWLYMCKDLTG